MTARRELIKYYGYFVDSLLETKTEDTRMNQLLKGSLTPDRFPTTSIRRVMVFEAGCGSISESDSEDDVEGDSEGDEGSADVRGDVTDYRCTTKVPP